MTIAVWALPEILVTYYTKKVFLYIHIQTHIHVYTYIYLFTHVYAYIYTQIYIMTIAVRAPPEIVQSRRLCGVALTWLSFFLRCNRRKFY